MTAPRHRSVDALSGVRRGPDRFVAANVQADERIAELEELRALKAETPESKQIAHQIAALVDSYLHAASDADQRTQVVILASLLRHSTAMCAAFGAELHHYEAEALDNWARAHLAEGELFDAQETIRRLESQLAEARSERDTLRARGGVA